MSDSTKAIDDRGQEMPPLTCSVICPAEHVEEARSIAAHHQTHLEEGIDDTPEKMLPTPLSPTGQFPATHFMCSRPAIYRNTVDVIRQTLQASESNGWTSGVVYSPAEAPADKFCQVVGDLQTLLAHLGLTEII